LRNGNASAGENAWGTKEEKGGKLKRGKGTWERRFLKATDSERRKGLIDAQRCWQGAKKEKKKKLRSKRAVRKDAYAPFVEAPAKGGKVKGGTKTALSSHMKVVSCTQLKAKEGSITFRTPNPYEEE